jgi:uncharacterized protein (TIGR01319 family)
VRPQEPALLIDFGSTYTKVVVVDLAREDIVGQAQAVTTVETGITIGLMEALSRLPDSLGQKARSFPHKLACSSAAGGLRVIALGLVPELTAEAAKRAALGAGARVLAVYAHHLTLRELEGIVAQAPDMVLLAGGTDGGDRRVILHNARTLASSALRAPIIVAGNKDAADEVEAILRQGGKEAQVTENVMPQLGHINVNPARQTIRKLFMERIVEAKGFKAAEAYVERILMPTPAAVMRAARLLAQGTDEEEGWGELIVVDVGGATTDVHSIATGEPQDATVIQRGLPEPYAKRTVEGDLGLRVSAVSLLAAVGEKRLQQQIGLEGNPNLTRITRRLARDVGRLPHTAEGQAIDEGLARAAVELSLERHVGTLRELYLPTGVCFVQEGKDLTRVRHLIGTGGIFCHTPRSREIIQAALFSPHNPLLLKPKAPRLWIDQRYVLWAMGLLAEVSPQVALHLMKKHLQEAPCTWTDWRQPVQDKWDCTTADRGPPPRRQGVGIRD